MRPRDSRSPLVFVSWTSTYGAFLHVGILRQTYEDERRRYGLDGMGGRHSWEAQGEYCLQCPGFFEETDMWTRLVFD